VETREQALGLHVGVREGAGGAEGSRVKCLGCLPVAAANVRTQGGRACSAEESDQTEQGRDPAQSWLPCV
jgi:hypothetical protein